MEAIQQVLVEVDAPSLKSRLIRRAPQCGRGETLL